MNDIKGFHHVTAITAQVSRNLRFYTEVMALRLVKKTVNQDDLSAYHLFYGDSQGTPGTDLTFFDWPQLPVKQFGNDLIRSTHFRVVSEAAVEFWFRRLSQFDLPSVKRVKVDDRSAVRFQDPEGQELLIIDDQGSDFSGQVWDGGGLIDPAYALRGFDSLLLSVPESEVPERVLGGILGWESGGSFFDHDLGLVVSKWVMAGGGPGRQLFVAVDPRLPAGYHCAGQVHHAAFRVTDVDELQAWIQRLNRYRHPHSGLVDRYYFQSLYFPVSQGVLFELATEGPGFSVDESSTELGHRLSLPPFLEPQRAEIEAGLKPLSS